MLDCVREPNSFPLANDLRPCAQSNCQFPQRTVNVVEMCVSVSTVSWQRLALRCSERFWYLEIFFMINVRRWPNKGRCSITLLPGIFPSSHVVLWSVISGVLNSGFSCFWKLRMCCCLKERIRAGLIFMWIPTKLPLFVRHCEPSVCSVGDTLQPACLFGADIVSGSVWNCSSHLQLFRTQLFNRMEGSAEIHRHLYAAVYRSDHPCETQPQQ